MIRFCDKEVGSVEFDEISRKELSAYFNSGHEEDILCVYDSFETMGYMGIITYRSLERSMNLNSAILNDYVILDQTIWENARYYFLHYDFWGFERYALLPILDERGQLVCFAYEDEDANREIRQLRELSELPDALQFQDIYPEYKCVKIHEFNELAYFFAKYLESQGITVQMVGGEVWKFFLNDAECQFPDYECLNIYAEGVEGKSRNWEENLLRSASVEFECIDKIYEENIRRGIIRDAEWNHTELFSYLKNKEVIILGTGKEEQAAYDLMLGEGVDIYGFVGDGRDKVCKLFGKRILSRLDVMDECHSPIFIDCTQKNSAWGFGEADYYDYIGYRRNINYFLLKDYLDIPENNLLNVLARWKVVLLGDIYLCQYLCAFFKQKKIPVIGYMEVLSQDDNWERKEIGKEDIGEDVICLFAIPELAAREDFKTREKIHQYLRENGLYRYSDYFSYTSTYINIEESNNIKISKKQLMPKRIVLGSIEDCSGNMLFKGLLDGHSEILSMAFDGLNKNLFWICIRLSMEKTENILPLFWEFYEAEGGKDIYNATAFNEKMEQLLAIDEQFTSQELFVMIFISFSYMSGKKVEIAKSIIYWEPHCLDRRVSDEYVRWLGTAEVSCDVISIVRNACMTSGSRIKGVMRLGWQSYASENAYIGVYNYGLCNFPSIEKRDYKWSSRLVVKFEDLKCNPQEILLNICDRWGISWSDTLMHVTRNGKERTYFNGEKKISDFDLEPVYNTYEEYFSEYDRFRITLLNALWQRRYNYPYVKLKQFSRRELQEMWLKTFRFENILDMKAVNLEFKMKIQCILRNQLQKVRMSELYNNDED